MNRWECAKVRVLVACEFSGVVREAFAKKGHDAWSCDLLDSELPGQHIKRDVLQIIQEPWDLIIAHPPCTYLCNSGVRWLYGGKGNIVDTDRWAALEQGAQFFKTLLNAAAPKIAVENPIMHISARRLIGKAPTQIIQPFEFGVGETKATCLWLKNLPLLKPTNLVKGRNPRVAFASPGPNRWKERSRTLPEIAAAMANQWGAPI